ncbi:PASTA domain-containing protein [Micromonospora sp. NPDC049836]|uniref:PASTA domain-containing protein n=1 Tax=Micromonospora sp. NPDC049836 TaxID=3364274 RepID=UPI0037B4580C
MTEAVDAMTDDGYPDGTHDPGSDRMRLVLGGGLAVVLLAMVGASGGWLLAGKPDRVAAPVTTGGPSSGPSSVAPTGAPQTSPVEPPTTPRTTAPVGLTVPEVVGTDFEAARRQLRDRKLGWQIVFGTGAGRSVQRTSPAPGTPVRRGVTVTLWVSGPAPAVAVPDVVAEDCDDAADDLVEAGLYPRYRTGRRGPVTAQEPAGGAAAHWNDPVGLSCGGEPAGSPAITLSPTP